MKDIKKVLEDYKVFNSDFRNTREGRIKAAALILAKESPDNLNVLAKKLSEEWSSEDVNVSRVKLSFASFEKKLENSKAEIIRIYAQEKEKQQSLSGMDNLQDN